MRCGISVLSLLIIKHVGMIKNIGYTSKDSSAGAKRDRSNQNGGRHGVLSGPSV